MQIIVIGGGAAGLMAAIMAARNHGEVTVLEQNEVPGRKILATGNGKCNLTNVRQEPSCYRSDHPEFPWKVVNTFPLKSTLQLFTSLGLYTKNKNGGLYPYSEQAAAVRDVLMMEARHLKVKLKTREHVIGIARDSGRFQIQTETYTYTADKVILAAGGHVSSVTGSCEDGFKLAESLGHHIISPLPALVGLKGVGNYFHKWSGVRFEAAVSLYIDEEYIISDRGELQFTDYGISGIPIFQISRFASRALHEKRQVKAVIDFMPDFNEEELLCFLENRMESCSYKTLPESMIGLLPQKLIPLLCTEIKYVAELIPRMKEFPVIIKSTCLPAQAQVCTGGVDTDEICAETMESRLVPGLHFAGEVVDVDGCCGGYNLQWAWSSGAVAGMASTEERI